MAYKSDAIVTSFGQKGVDTTKLIESDIVCGKCFDQGDPTIWPNKEELDRHIESHKR